MDSYHLLDLVDIVGISHIRFVRWWNPDQRARHQAPHLEALTMHERLLEVDAIHLAVLALAQELGGDGGVVRLGELAEVHSTQLVDRVPEDRRHPLVRLEDRAIELSETDPDIGAAER